jgi:microcompartment protein PduB
MDKNELVNQIIERLESGNGKEKATDIPQMKVGESGNLYKLFSRSEIAGYTEFIGTGAGDTLGLVIPNLDFSIHEKLGIDSKIRSLGILSSRSGAGPQAMGADEAIKSSNIELVKVYMARDTKGGAGHGITIIIGAEDVSDVRRAIEVMLKTFEWSWGDQYSNATGHCEVQFTARAGKFLAQAFGAEEGKSWGLICGAPVAVGLLMADRAVKAADVEIIDIATPDYGTSHSNEFMAFIKGDSGAVKQAVIEAREAGIKSLEVLGGPVAASGPKPYIF